MFFDETCASYWQLMAIYCMISWAQHVLRNCEACGQWPRALVPHMFHHVPFLHWMYGYETDMKWIWNGYEWYWYLLNLLVAWHFQGSQFAEYFCPKCNFWDDVRDQDQVVTWNVWERPWNEWERPCWNVETTYYHVFAYFVLHMLHCMLLCWSRLI